MRHRRMLAPINTIKHYVQETKIAVASGAVRNIVIADSVVAPATGNTFDVKEGSIIKAIFFEYWLSAIGTAGSNTQFAMLIEKVPTNTAAVTAAQIVNLASYPNKKNIFFYSQGVLASENDGATSVPITRSFMLVPKGKQRFGITDRMVVTIFALGTAIDVCGFSTYKEYI